MERERVCVQFFSSTTACCKVIIQLVDPQMWLDTVIDFFKKLGKYPERAHMRMFQDLR